MRMSYLLRRQGGPESQTRMFSDSAFDFQWKMLMFGETPMWPPTLPDRSRIFPDLHSFWVECGGRGADALPHPQNQRKHFGSSWFLIGDGGRRRPHPSHKITGNIRIPIVFEWWCGGVDFHSFGVRCGEAMGRCPTVGCPTTVKNTTMSIIW